MGLQFSSFADCLFGVSYPTSKTIPHFEDHMEHLGYTQEIEDMIVVILRVIFIKSGSFLCLAHL